MAYLIFLAAIASAYLIGSLPTSYIFARALKGIDIRQAGSGNVGATNTFRVVGKLPGILTLIIDILKGVFAVTIAAEYFYTCSGSIDHDLYRCAMGFAAMCGHVWPIWLKFKGGKGIATTLGIVGAISPDVFVLSGILWILVFSMTNFVSLASIVLVVTFPIFAVIIGKPISIVLLLIGICLITTYRHKDNISRLIKGNENKIFLFKKRQS